METSKVKTDTPAMETFAALVRRHVEAEFRMDVDATLATICPNPHFELHPLGLYITTRDAVREFYRRVLKVFDQLSPTAEIPFQGENAIVLSHASSWRSAGCDIPIKVLGMFVMDPETKLIKGEHIYFSADALKLVAEALGKDFASLPGVEREH